jgi:hypothetical protein
MWQKDTWNATLVAQSQPQAVAVPKYPQQTDWLGALSTALKSPTTLDFWIG